MNIIKFISKKACNYLERFEKPNETARGKVARVSDWAFKALKISANFFIIAVVSLFVTSIMASLKVAGTRGEGWSNINELSIMVAIFGFAGLIYLLLDVSDNIIYEYQNRLLEKEKEKNQIIIQEKKLEYINFKDYLKSMGCWDKVEEKMAGFEASNKKSFKGIFVSVFSTLLGFGIFIIDPKSYLFIIPLTITIAFALENFLSVIKELSTEYRENPKNYNLLEDEHFLKMCDDLGRDGEEERLKMFLMQTYSSMPGLKFYKNARIKKVMTLSFLQRKGGFNHAMKNVVMQYAREQVKIGAKEREIEQELGIESLSRLKVSALNTNIEDIKKLDMVEAEKIKAKEEIKEETLITQPYKKYLYHK